MIARERTVEEVRGRRVPLRRVRVLIMPMGKKVVTDDEIVKLVQQLEVLSKNLEL